MHASTYIDSFNAEPAKTAMKIRDYLIILALLALLLVGILRQTTYKPPSRGRVFSLTVRVLFENREGQRIWNLTEDYRTIGLFVNSSWQEVYLAKTSHRLERIKKDYDGNTLAILNLTREFIEPGEKIGYNVTYILVFKERGLPNISEGKSGKINEIPEENRREYCQPTSLWQSNVSVLMEKALEIAGNETNVLNIVKKFIIWISREIKYESSELPKYPLETFLSRRGDCDDQANLLITFCRAVGIPAYLQVGCIYIQGWSSNRSYYIGHLLFRQIRVGWHGWAMVFIPPWGWLPVDLTYVEADLEREPLKSITSSAILKHYTFHYMNITKTDYAAEARLLKDFLESHEFYIYEEDIMEEKTLPSGLYPNISVPPIILLNLDALFSSPRRVRMRIIYM
ncbi:MAG: transglutaminase-like domain-containing protein [Candidatus Bathyarchaeota archaeon]|nr:transglutaminase-like domain-containing protein [Candidatus Bathyarchaeota archaeon]